MERTFFHPANLQEALSILAIHPHAAVVAGGTDLVVGARSGKEPLPPTLLAIDRIRELSDIRSTSEGGLEIGALATHAALEISITVQSSCTALSDASALVGSPATRNLGTIGGNICNASPAMELGSPLLIFDAAVELISIDGLRRLPFSAFVTGPGRTERRPSELLRSVIIPLLPSRGRLGSAYLRLEYRKAMEIAIVGAAAFLRMDPKGRCLYARIALTAVAPTCVRALGAEAVLTGEIITPKLMEQAASAAAANASPIDDVRGSAEYRRAMVVVLVERALTVALHRATGDRSIPEILALEMLDSHTEITE